MSLPEDMDEKLHHQSVIPSESVTVNCRTKEDHQKVQELEAKLKDVAVVCEWRLEQLKLMDAEKRAAEKALEEERRLFASLLEDQAREHTARIEALQENWVKVMTRAQDGALRGNAGNFGVQGPQMEQVSAEGSIRKLEKSVDGMRVQLKLRSDERDKWKATCKRFQQEAGVCEQRLKQISVELGKRKAEAIEGKNQEEVCKDLLEQLEQRNVELQRSKEERQKTVKWHTEMQREINQHKEEILQYKKLLDELKITKPEVTECIICLDEFGAEPDRQRALWTDCNHANICYKCTSRLWISKKRKCPTCNTLASTRPGPLPLNIYL